jgi:hypothetical protein
MCDMVTPTICYNIMAKPKRMTNWNREALASLLWEGFPPWFCAKNDFQ